ncbi:MAG: OadG family transporter subunit [Bacteroidales bacterium]
MKIKKIALLLLVGFALSTSTLLGQNPSEIRINEVLIENSESITDSYGTRSSWIEFFNTSYSTVDIGGCYISDDPNNLKKYMIPRGDATTIIPPRQIMLFFASGESHKGSHHTNFSLTNSNSNRVFFVSHDGRTIIDQIEIPRESLKKDHSYGRTIDGGCRWNFFEFPSPGSANSPSVEMPAGDKFRTLDPFGIIMAITAMSVVFSALFLLYIVFKQVGKYNIKLTRKRSAIATGKGVQGECSGEEASAEVFAAIATALHLHLKEEEAHDIESSIITMEKVTRNYSPWSSKIYTLREVPKKQ